MRKLCPNLEREDGLETVLEVPIPEEMFAPSSNNSSSWRTWQNMKSWMRSNNNGGDKPQFLLGLENSRVFGTGSRSTDIQLLLGVIGAPLIPLPITNTSNNPVISKDYTIECSMAKYIVQQYIAASGGEMALDSIHSMYAMGKVKMTTGATCDHNNKSKPAKDTAAASIGELGGFVVWQKRPELWCLELVVSGYKISAGSDGKVAWRQTPWHHSHASRGPPRPLRRFLQGLDPRSTANLFSNSVCIGEKSINEEDCFVLKIEADSSTLNSRSSPNVEIIRHTLWGYFSQRTGLLVHLHDSHLLRIKSEDHHNICWETTMESLVHDYRTIDGVNIAHAGRTSVSLYRYGDAPDTSTRMEEVWSIEEVDFNIKGLSIECFLPPADLNKVDNDDDQGCVVVPPVVVVGNLSRLAPFRRSNGNSRVAAIIDQDYHDSSADEEADL